MICFTKANYKPVDFIKPNQIHSVLNGMMINNQLLSQWIRPLYLSNRQKQHIYKALGGRFSFWSRIKKKGVGVGGLTISQKHKNLPLKYIDASERVQFTIEEFKQGFLLGLNNTKEVWWLALPSANISFDKISTTSPYKIRILFDTHEFIINVNKWNYQEVCDFFDRVCTSSHIA